MDDGERPCGGSGRESGGLAPARRAAFLRL